MERLAWYMTLVEVLASVMERRERRFSTLLHRYPRMDFCYFTILLIAEDMSFGRVRKGRKAIGSHWFTRSASVQPRHGIYPIFSQNSIHCPAMHVLLRTKG